MFSSHDRSGTLFINMAFVLFKIKQEGIRPWVSPGYAYLGFGTVYVANVNDTAHLYCWHAGNPNLMDSPGHPSYVCGVPMEWATVPAPLWPGVPTMIINSEIP